MRTAGNINDTILTWLDQLGEATTSLLPSWQNLAHSSMLRTCNASLHFCRLGIYMFAVNPNVGEAAEVLHRSFLKHLLGVETCTANKIVFAEFGRFPLWVHFWQQILRYHHRVGY